MNHVSVQGFAQTVALLAQLEGMKATNAECVVRGEIPVHKEEDFHGIQAEAESIARHVAEWGWQ